MISKIILGSHEEWLEHRKRYIGGSDASAIVGMNPYKDNVSLWKEKTGRLVPEDISDKTYVKYGHDAEPLIRQLFALDHPEYEVLYEDNNSWLNDKFPFAAASLDGWLVERETGRHGILEIKTTNILQSMQKEKWKDKIPDNYYIQILHYLMIREDCEFARLSALLRFEFDGQVYGKIRNYHIERSEIQDDIAYLQRKETEFSEYINTGFRPPLVLPDI